MSRPWLKWAILAGVIGVILCMMAVVGLGLVLSLGLKAPAQASPEEHALQVAVAYAADQDLEKAQAQLAELDVPNTNQWIAGLIDRCLAEGRDPAEVRALMELAQGLGVSSPAVLAYMATLTPAPTDTPLPTQTPLPTATPAPTETPIPPTETPTEAPTVAPPTATPSPTETPPPATPTQPAAPTDTPRPRPTPTPSATPTPSVLFEDHFEQGADKWTPYLNLGRLAPGQWYWDAQGGYEGSGGYRLHHSAHGTSNKSAEDALTMVLAKGSEGWGDYRARVKFNIHGGRKVGLWFRGAYKEANNKGQWVVGYYCMVVLRDGNDRVQLHQLRTFEDPGSPPPEYDKYYYHFTNPFEIAKGDLGMDVSRDKWYELIVEVRGANIKCYVGDKLAVDHTDGGGSVFLNGTIGLKVYGSSGSQADVAFDDVIVEPLK